MYTMKVKLSVPKSLCMFLSTLMINKSPKLVFVSLSPLYTTLVCLFSHVGFRASTTYIFSLNERVRNRWVGD